MASVAGFDRVKTFAGQTVLADLDPDDVAPTPWPHGDSSRSLTKLIEGEIIPRLMVAHARGDCGRAPDSGAVVGQAEIEAFTPLTLAVEADALLDYVEGLLRRGVSVETVLIDLLAPAARRLGLFWEEDRCDFVEVTMGLWRLQEVAHDIAARLPSHRLPETGRPRALFAPMPGEQHSFGTVLVEEIFAREGWGTDLVYAPNAPELAARLADRWFDLIGLTVSCDCNIGALPSLILSLRAASRNPDLCVMVGGRVFVEDPALAARVGADGTAADAKMAIEIAGKMVGASQREAVRG